MWEAGQGLFALQTAPRGWQGRVGIGIIWSRNAVRKKGFGRKTSGELLLIPKGGRIQLSPVVPRLGWMIFQGFLRIL